LGPEAEKSLKTAGDVELPRLGVVPQTVFLKAHATEFRPRSSRAQLSQSRRSMFDIPGRTPILSTPRTSRVPSIDPSSTGAPFEDLCRRLATPPQTAQHPLLAQLAPVSHRYDDLQHAFRDCHLALQDLRKTISNSSKSSPSSKSSRSTFNTPQILQTALERLEDCNEDARVELETRTADEALLARGFEMRLSVPGALPSRLNSRSRHSLRAQTPACRKLYKASYGS